MEEIKQLNDDEVGLEPPCKKPNLDQTEEEEVLPTIDADGKPILFNGVEITKLTKTQMKKYRKMLKWEASKKEKRVKERLKMKNKKVEAKKNNIDLGPSRKQLKKATMANSSCKIGIAIDLSFDDLMIPKDLGKVIKQILRVYTENRRSSAPMQLHLTSFTGKSREEMSKHNGYEHWDMNFHEESYSSLFPKEKLVYLTSESDNIINELEEDKIYIIGGLVDHNSHKGICFNKAVKEGISHGQLPIGEYFTLKTRKVFTINQVFEILLRVSEGKTYKEAFESTLPKRNNMQPTNSDANVDQNDPNSIEKIEESECANNDSS
ncbi:PREDICTED: tRNA methyltransferase 10 homolog A [Nicrophorus vespilloides]|uniref:tRNA (guanine(9)-N(1))-methyltransferase n=1 Tax=Nicrophorus vespilloides TaxID=110193 RepID=A0ABM1MEX0_NICVS|nr:PREDICTED: tRNA methyltransferase 10 homolog A [Nicrophorus vespilloides]